MKTAREETTRLADLLWREHHALADFLVALAAFDAAGRWEELGHRSLFSFLVRELGLSKGAAYYRNRAAELVRKVPQVLEPLRDGRLCLSSVAELASVLTPENVADVLPPLLPPLAVGGEGGHGGAPAGPCAGAPHRGDGRPGGDDSGGPLGAGRFPGIPRSCQLRRP